VLFVRCWCVGSWSYGVMVSTLDFESSDPGSSPGRTSFMSSMSKATCPFCGSWRTCVTAWWSLLGVDGRMRLLVSVGLLCVMLLLCVAVCCCCCVCVCVAVLVSVSFDV